MQAISQRHVIKGAFTWNEALYQSTEYLTAAIEQLPAIFQTKLRVTPIPGDEVEEEKPEEDEDEDDDDDDDDDYDVEETGRRRRRKRKKKRSTSGHEYTRLALERLSNMDRGVCGRVVPSLSDIFMMSAYSEEDADLLVENNAFGLIRDVLLKPEWSGSEVRNAEQALEVNRAAMMALGALTTESVDRAAKALFTPMLLQQTVFSLLEFRWDNIVAWWGCGALANMLQGAKIEVNNAMSLALAVMSVLSVVDQPESAMMALTAVRVLGSTTVGLEALFEHGLTGGALKRVETQVTTCRKGEQYFDVHGEAVLTAAALMRMENVDFDAPKVVVNFRESEMARIRIKDQAMSRLLEAKMARVPKPDTKEAKEAMKQRVPVVKQMRRQRLEEKRLWATKAAKYRREYAAISLTRAIGRKSSPQPEQQAEAAAATAAAATATFSPPAAAPSYTPEAAAAASSYPPETAAAAAAAAAGEEASAPQAAAAARPTDTEFEGGQNARLASTLKKVNQVNKKKHKLCYYCAAFDAGLDGTPSTSMTKGRTVFYCLRCALREAGPSYEFGPVLFGNICCQCPIHNTTVRK